MLAELTRREPVLKICRGRLAALSVLVVAFFDAQEDTPRPGNYRYQYSRA